METPIEVVPAIMTFYKEDQMVGAAVVDVNYIDRFNWELTEDRIKVDLDDLADRAVVELPDGCVEQNAGFFRYDGTISKVGGATNWQSCQRQVSVPATPAAIATA